MNKYTHIKGNNYENYILNKLKLEYDNIWFFKNTPEKILQNTKLLDNYEIYTKYKNCDIGADLVAIKNDQIFFIQCKNHNNTLCINDLQGFYFFLYEFELNGIVIYSNQISSRIKDLANKVSYIHIPFNNQLIDTEFNIINNYEINPRDYQLEAYNLLKNENRSVLSLPCGMGKTYTAFMIANNYDNIILISPLRFLAKQLLDQVYKYSNQSYNPILLSVDGERKINNIILENRNIISSTYDSVDILFKLLEKLENKIIIVDEFHNLSQNNLFNNDDNFNKILISNNKILFLSATPTKNKLFGTIIYKYSWLEAIEKKYICDFNIILPDKNESLKKFDNVINDLELTNKKLVSKAYFYLRCLLFEGKRKSIVFLTCIEQADEFNKILLWMQQLLNIEVYTNIISYNKSRLKRIEIINNFKLSEKISILLNIHILDEGIDIPECDSVYIIQPNNNILNLIQRMCRCNRITNEKNKSLIILWCGNNKTQKILDYLNEKTHSELLNKVYKLNIDNANKNKYKINLKLVNEYPYNFNMETKLEDLIIKSNITNNFFNLDGNIDTNINFDDFIKLLKKYTTIDINFIDTFFSKFKIGGELHFDIKDIHVAKYLGITIITLRKRLLNIFSKTKRFFEKVDFIKIKTGNTTGVVYMLNYQCFEKLAMSGDSKESENVREYFVKLREFLVENQKIIYQSITNKEDLKKYGKFESIYFFVVDERKKDFFKIGRTIDIVNRLRNYNVGRIKEVDLKYFAIVKNSLLIENCIKFNLKNKQVFEKKEIYHTTPENIKKIIDKCYCKYVSKKENDDLYKELSDLLGLYSYSKNKVNIKPYIIIGNNI